MALAICRYIHDLRASKTLSGVANGIRRYIYMVRARHFSSAGPVVRNV